MAGRKIALRSLRLIDKFNIKWSYLVPNLHCLAFYSSASEYSSTFMPRLPRDTHSNVLNSSKPRLYNSSVKPYAVIDPLDKSKSSTINLQASLEDFLSSELPFHPKLIRGQLKNGLRYRILEHKKHPNRFEAHLVVNVGSIHEEEDEQGIAHMTEHVVDSDKCRRLHAVGIKQAAHTNFRWTDYHICSQTILKHFDEDLLDGDLVDGDLVPLVLDALNEEVFKPKIKASNLEKERHIVLSELQLRTTIDKRIDNQLRQHLHSENKLSKRRVLGLEDQIKKWSVAQIKKFHKRWYFPRNATLYIVGDINTSKTIDAIQETFGKSEKLLHKRCYETIKKEGPLIYHNWSLPLSNADDQKHPQIFQHMLIHNFSFYIYSKIPVNKFRSYGDLRNFIMRQIYLSVLRLRIYEKYKNSNSSSTLMELHHDDIDYYGCALTNLIITSEPKDWNIAIKIAFHEVRRLKELGINNDEFTLHKNAIMKDVAYLIPVLDEDSSRVLMKFIIEKDVLDHTIMEQRDAREILSAVAPTITLEEVNSIGSELLDFISDFGKPCAPVPAAIMACVPSIHEENGELVEFNINPSDIECAIKQGLEEPIYVEPEIEVPTELISSSQLQELLLECQPTFIPLGSKPDVKKLHDKRTNITQRRLSNEISVNYKMLKSEGDEAVIRVLIGGGRALESSDLKGAIAVGVQTLLEGFCVGHFSRKQVERFCMKNKIYYSLYTTEEFICMELISYTLRDNGMQAAFQLLHMLLEQSIWLEDAFDRARQLYMSNFISNLKNLEEFTTRKLLLAMLDGDERFVEPTKISLQNLTFHSVKNAVLNLFTGNNMEVSIVGDFSEDEIESNIINYFGTIKVTRNFKNELHEYDPIIDSTSPSHLQSQVILKDTEKRTHACVAGLTPNIWGSTFIGKCCPKSKLFIEGLDLQSRPRAHPLFFNITMEFVAHIIDDMLRKEVIASGLAYEAELDIRLLNRLNLGWYMIHIASTPTKVHETTDVCKNVLKGFNSRVFSQEYLDKVRGRLLTKHEDETKTNAYWLELLCQLQASKDVSCIEDPVPLYKIIDNDDIHFVYDQLKVSDDSIYSCIGLTEQLEITDISA